MLGAFPFLTNYDPPGTSEGSLDPMGLYQIADQLAIQLVPAVRERMQRIRFLTAMAIGAIVTEGLGGDPEQQDAFPYLVWEWLVVEAIIRTKDEAPLIWGVPGTLVARRAIKERNYLDARSYLKTARIFGFNGVYKRLAVHLGLVDVHLGPGPNAEGLADAWARDLGFARLSEANELLGRWSTAVRRSLVEKPPHTKPGWNRDAWLGLATAFLPGECGPREKRFLKSLLLATDDRQLGALSAIWQLQAEFNDEGYTEELLHDRLGQREPDYRQILEAMRAYEAFSRSLQDGFDILKAEAARSDAQGFVVAEIAPDTDFRRSVEGLHDRFAKAHHALGEVTVTSLALQNVLSERFEAFAEPMDAKSCALTLCCHHEAVQRGKSASGKRPWFDRIGQDRIYIRHAYREPRPVAQPDRYVHAYRGWPIRRFYLDLL